LSPNFKSFRKEIEVKPLFSRNLSLFSKEENKNISFQKLLFLISQVDISKNIGINILRTYFSKPLETFPDFLAKLEDPK
jgi:hypothetical protein